MLSGRCLRKPFLKRIEHELHAFPPRELLILRINKLSGPSEDVVGAARETLIIGAFCKTVESGELLRARG